MIEYHKLDQIIYFDTASDLLEAVKHAVIETDVVADVGCGILPMSYFRPKLHFMIEPWYEYVDILTYRYSGDKSVVILKSGALETLTAFAQNSVDSIFLIDVIEHLDKEDGIEVLKECERVARKQIVIFTPLGFMPQSVQSGTKDAWGLSGTDDFDSAWSFYICKEFHKKDYKDEPLDQPYGAFFAIRNFDEKVIDRPISFSDIRRPLPSEEDLNVMNQKYNNLQLEHQNLQLEHQNLQLVHQNFQAEQKKLINEWEARYNILANSLHIKILNHIKNLFKALGIRK